MTPQLKLPVTFPEDTSVIPNTHIVAHNHP